MQKLRFLPLAAIGLAFGLLTACDSTSSKDAPSVSTALYVSGNPTTLQANTTYHLAGTVENVTSWSWTVVNSATGKTVATISADAPNGSGSTDVGKGSSSKLVEFTVTSAWGATGTYVITGALTGTDGSTINTTVTVTATPGGTNTTETPLSSVVSLDVAAQGVTGVNSFISIGNAKSYSGTETKTYFANTDLVITYDAANTTQTNFESTAEGVSDNTLGSTYWGTGRATLITDVGSTEPTSLTTAKASLGTAQSAAIVSGHYYVVKTVEGIYAVLYASNLSGTGNSLTLTVKILE
jgi:hypothetical protein